MPITLENYYTNHQTGEDYRQTYGDYYTPEILEASVLLLQKVNSLLADLGVITCILNSGWRAPPYNTSIGGAKNSAHCTGEALDISDRAGELKKQITDKPELLEKYDLYMEDPSATKTWAHLQTRKTTSGKRIFKP